MFLKRRFGHQSYCFLGQIVFRGAKATGGDNHLRAFQRLAQGLLQPLRIVAHGMHLQKIHTQCGKLPRHMGCIRIDRMPQQEFCADRYYFRLHAASVLLDARPACKDVERAVEHPSLPACTAQD